MANEGRAYATDNGFYVGDKVQYRREGDEEGNWTVSYIEEIVSKGHETWFGNPTKKIAYQMVPCSIVKLEDGTTTLDIRLTRIK